MCVLVGIKGSNSVCVCVCGSRRLRILNQQLQQREKAERESTDRQCDSEGKACVCFYTGYCAPVATPPHGKEPFWLVDVFPKSISTHTISACIDLFKVN